VTPSHNLTEARPAAQRDGLVSFRGGSLVAGTIARTVDQPKYLPRFCQRDQQWMIAPGSLVGNVHPLLALAAGDHQRPVHVDRGAVEKLRRLLRPNVQPGVVDGIHQIADVLLGKTPTEVTSRGRIGNPLGAQGVEEHLVIAAQFNVFQPDAVAHSVVRQIQYVIRLMIGAMHFEQVEATVDGLDQSGLLGQAMYQSDAPCANGSDSICQFHLQVLRGKHRPATVFPWTLQPLLDPTLGLPKTILYIGVHSKSSLLPGRRLRFPFLRHRKTRKVSSFFTKSA